MFSNKRGATHTGPYWSVDFYNSATNNVNLYYPRIQGVISAWGGGFRAAQVLGSGNDIDWSYSGYMLLGAAASATDTTITISTSGTNDCLRIGDTVVIGQAALSDADSTRTIPEYRTVINRVGTTVTLDDALDYDHANGDRVYVNALPNIVTGWGVGVKAVLSAIVTNGYSVIPTTGGYYNNVRQYLGPDTYTTSKIAPAQVLRAFRDEPGNPEQGLLAVMRSSGDFTTTTDLDGWTIDNLLVLYAGLSGDAGWYAAGGLLRKGTATWDPGSLADGASATTTVTVTGAAVADAATDMVIVGMHLAVSNVTETGAWQISGRISATDTVTVTLTNHTGGVKDLDSATVHVAIMKC
jgi:hypothetical protein